MIETRNLEYSYDEENLGFPEPPKAEERKLDVWEKLSLALVGLGVLIFIILLFNTPLRGTWLGFISAFAPMVVG